MSLLFPSTLFVCMPSWHFHFSDLVCIREEKLLYVRYLRFQGSAEALSLSLSLHSCLQPRQSLLQRGSRGACPLVAGSLTIRQIDSSSHITGCLAARQTVAGSSFHIVWPSARPSLAPSLSSGHPPDGPRLQAQIPAGDGPQLRSPASSSTLIVWPATRSPPAPQSPQFPGPQSPGPQPPQSSVPQSPPEHSRRKKMSTYQTMQANFFLSLDELDGLVECVKQNEQ